MAEEIPSRTLDELLAICRFMADFPGEWWIGGGWSIDLWAGAPSRTHEDIEICLWHKDQQALLDYCAGYQFFTPVDHQWVPLPAGELLQFPEFQLQVRAMPDTPQRVAGLPPEFEFMLNFIRDGEWVFRPEPDIRLPLPRVYSIAPSGVPVAAPEILLLHKCRHHRPKDEYDFDRVHTLLNPEQRDWLRTQISSIRPEDPWLRHLQTSS